jgi:hypothetical protein
LERTIATQRLRLTFLREGDVDTKFFHLQSCHWGRKNYINHLNHQGTWITDEDVKAQAVWEHFSAILGMPEDRSHSLDLGLLGMVSADLQSLNHCFSKEEIWSVIRAMSADKAPGPDGFTRHFYQTAFVIRYVILQVLCAFWALDSRSFFLLNQTYMVLLRKMKDATEIRNFRPISLIHSFVKLMIAKVLSTRLAPFMPRLVASN